MLYLSVLGQNNQNKPNAFSIHFVLRGGAEILNLNNFKPPFKTQIKVRAPCEIVRAHWQTRGLCWGPIIRIFMH